MAKLDDQWKCFGKVPKQEVVFLTQVILIYTIVTVSIINLSLGNGDSNLWCVLISFSAGSLLPSPNPYKTLNRNLKSGGQTINNVESTSLETSLEETEV